MVCLFDLRAQGMIEWLFCGFSNDSLIYCHYRTFLCIQFKLVVQSRVFQPYLCLTDNLVHFHFVVVGKELAEIQVHHDLNIQPEKKMSNLDGWTLTLIDLHVGFANNPSSWFVYWN